MRFAVVALLLIVAQVTIAQPDGDLNNKGVALMDQEKYAEALPYFDKLVARNPGSTLYRYNRAITRTHLKNYRAALQDYLELT
ncbi:MAG TPA: tetratricopeptide repeat protein, partial [Cyclobacteriaceae bacterium]|nr:tetratricopeptide repeat protein [Cyclobacteriaceae bacterium]